MTVTCIGCTRYDMRAAGPDLAQQGYGLCARDKEQGRYQSATYGRECEQFEQAAAETINRRYTVMTKGKRK